MGDYPTKQSELITRDNLGPTNLEIPNNDIGTKILNDPSTTYLKPEICSRFPFSDGLNSANSSRNFNRDYSDSNLQNNEFNDKLNYYFNQCYGTTTTSTANNNNGNIQISQLVNDAQNGVNCDMGPSQQNRDINQHYTQAPYLVTVIPSQIDINQNLTNPGQVSAGTPGFYSQVPVAVAVPEPTALYYHNTPQRPHYFHPVKPMRQIEFSWCHGKVSSMNKSNMQPMYAGGQAADTKMQRNFGPIGAEVAGLRCGLAVRNFPSQLNMVRTFPSNRAPINFAETNTNYFVSQKQSKLLAHVNTEKSDEHFNGKVCKSNANSSTVNVVDTINKKNKSRLVTSSVHLGGVLTIPKSVVEPSGDIYSSQSSSVSSDNSNNSKMLNNSIALFRESATQGCNEIQKLILQYNIKSPTLNMENLCKSVHRQMNNTKNIVQMEPIMREMILGYLYLSSSWTSLGCVLAVQREHASPLDGSLEVLRKEFLTWQKKSKILLEQIIVSLKKIPEEHEKYIAGIYKCNSTSSENSTILSDGNFTDSEIEDHEVGKNNYWENNKLYNDLNKETMNNIQTPKSNANNSYVRMLKLNPKEHNPYTNGQTNDRNKLCKWDNNHCSQTKGNTNERILRPRQIALVDSSLCTTNGRRYSQNVLPNNNGNGRKNYSSNRPLARNKYDTSAFGSPRNIRRK